MMTAMEFGRAIEYFNEHEKHVSSLMKYERHSYEPTGSDKLNPALWKAAHWHWFFSELKEIGVMKNHATRQELTDILRQALESLEWQHKRLNPEWKGEAGPYSVIGKARSVLGLPAKDWEKVS